MWWANSEVRIGFNAVQAFTEVYSDLKDTNLLACVLNKHICKDILFNRLTKYKLSFETPCTHVCM